MIATEFGIAGRARLWLQPLSECKCEAAIRRQAVASRHSAVFDDERVSVIEVAIPVGGMRLYGLLGARFTPGGKELVVELRGRQRGNGQEVFPLALIADRDTVLCGLPDEFASPVMAEASARGLALGSGELVFEYAAHDPVGSSAEVFRGLTRLVVLSLATDPARQGDASLLDGLRGAFPQVRMTP